MARAVKAGGRLLLHAYGDPHAIEFLGFMQRTALRAAADVERYAKRSGGP
jgi:hypothetical protein